MTLDERVSSIQNLLDVDQEERVKQEEREDRLSGEIKPTLYKRRWYILIIFGLVACLQGALCIVWTVMAESTEAAFGWTNWDMSIFTIWIYASYIIGIGPFIWLIQWKGLRVSVVIATLLTFLGCLSRIITSSTPYVTWCAHVGQIFNGFAGPVLFTGAPQVSAAWFPPKQRATATAIGAITGIAGSALMFIIDPNVVPGPIKSTPTDIHQVSHNFTNISEIKAALMYLRYGEFTISAILLVLVLIYFPAKPPSPPSISAATEIEPFFKGVRKIFSLQKMNFWYVALAGGLSLGLINVYAGLLDVNLKTMGIAQTTAGWMNFYATLASSAFSLVLGRLADEFIGYRKLILMVMAVISVLSTFVVVLNVYQYIPFNIYVLYVSYIVTGIAMNGCLPLYFECAIETTFPVSEGVTMGIFTMSLNVFPIFVLLVLDNPKIGTLWMNWCLYGAAVICVPILLLYKEHYHRLSLDDKDIKFE